MAEETWDTGGGSCYWAAAAPQSHVSGNKQTNKQMNS